MACCAGAAVPTDSLSAARTTPPAPTPGTRGGARRPRAGPVPAARAAACGDTASGKSACEGKGETRGTSTASTSRAVPAGRSRSPAGTAGNAGSTATSCRRCRRAPGPDSRRSRRRWRCRDPGSPASTFRSGCRDGSWRTVGWPAAWRDYVRHAESLGKREFEAALNTYRRNQPYGQKEHRRGTDVLAGSISPQKLYFPPVGKMFFQGVARLAEAGVEVPGLQEGDPNRTLVEGYPGVLARSVTKEGYKHDDPRKQVRPAQRPDFEGADERRVGGALRHCRDRGRSDAGRRPDGTQPGRAAGRGAGRLGVAEPRAAFRSIANRSAGRVDRRSAGGLQAAAPGREW